MGTGDSVRSQTTHRQFPGHVGGMGDAHSLLGVGHGQTLDRQGAGAGGSP